MVDSDTDRLATSRAGPASGDAPRPPALAPSLERRNRRRRAVWYSILGLLIVAGLTLPFVFKA